MIQSLLMSLLLGAGAVINAAPAPSAVVDAGVIIGTATTLPSSTVKVNKFLGIPYAQPPVDQRRFLPPEPITTFKQSPLLATAWGSKCLDYTSSELPGMFSVTHRPQPLILNSLYDDGIPESEDCLFVNVYAPDQVNCSTAQRPVLLWIHGGWLRTGTASQPMFDGTGFAAKHGLVVVTFNYRLNVFGFPNSPQLSLEEQNLGFLDQRLALDWVQSNIHAFGGDPSKVTIAGESSGGGSVDRLLTTTHSNPPFRAAACSSGQSTVSAIGRESGPLSWAALASLVGCSSGDDEIACVRATDGKTIRDVIVANGLDFSPVNDNVTQMELPYLPARAAGAVASVPLLIGSTGQEGTYLAIQYGVNISAVTESEVVQLIGFISGGDTQITEAIMQVVLFIQQSTGIPLFYAAVQVFTELIYQCPAFLISRTSIQSGIPTWRYLYNASFPNMGRDGYSSEELGAVHGSDTPMIWGTYPKDGATDQQIELSRYLQEAWAGFVKDPAGKGPGWGLVSLEGDNIACVGCNGTIEAMMLESADIDSRCTLYEPFFSTVKTPFIKA